MAQISSSPAVTLTPVTQFVGPQVTVCSAEGTLSFFGVTPPVAQQTVAAAGTDTATVMVLVNDLRTALINYGLVV